MTVLDPGHKYELFMLDNPEQARHLLLFVKREGPKYPGNVGHHYGTNLQDVFRACIERFQYLQKQEPCDENLRCIARLRMNIMDLEWRAARKHGRRLKPFNGAIESEPFCVVCGHIQCPGHDTNHSSISTAQV